MTIRTAQPDDLRAIVNLARRTLQASQWTEEQFAKTLKENSHRTVWVDCRESTVTGFLIASEIASEWEIENIVIDPTSQRMNIATMLVQELIRKASEQNGRCVYLEVRSQNIPALSLYRKIGFVLVGLRKDYYSNPQDDALLFRLELREIHT